METQLNILYYYTTSDMASKNSARYDVAGAVGDLENMIYVAILAAMPRGN
jgi:hypothetical protein